MVLRMANLAGANQHPGHYLWQESRGSDVAVGGNVRLYPLLLPCQATEDPSASGGMPLSQLSGLCL